MRSESQKHLVGKIRRGLYVFFTVSAIACAQARFFKLEDGSDLRLLGSAFKASTPYPKSLVQNDENEVFCRIEFENAPPLTRWNYLCIRERNAHELDSSETYRFWETEEFENENN